MADDMNEWLAQFAAEPAPIEADAQLRAACAQLFAVFTELQQAGFSRREALALTAQMTRPPT